MAQAWRVTQWTQAPSRGGTRVSALLDGTEVWFESPTLASAPECGDPFLAVALLAAMAAGRPLDLRDLPPVSPRLLDTLPTIQSLWTQWNPELTRIEVLAHRGETGHPATTPVTFFSGGVDAVHAALDAADPGERLVFIDGFDFSFDAETLAQRRPALERLAGRLGGELVVVRTNWIVWRRELHLSAGLLHAGLLVAVGQLLGARRATISSSNSHAHLTPWGSHPLSDPLWSTETTTIRHWGVEYSRAEKIQRLAEVPELLDDLWVCHTQPIGNCGRCPKCARTRLAFWLAGTELPVEPAARTTDALSAYLQHLSAGSEHIYLEELTDLARARGDTAALRELNRGGRRLARRRLLRDVRNALFPRAAARRMASADLRPWGHGPGPLSP